MLLGLLKKKECWCLTWRGWTVLLLMFILGTIAIIKLTFPFLAVTDPVKADVLVLEAWLPDFCLQDVKSRFKQDGYKMLILTGGAIPRGEPFAEFKTYPEMMRAVLLKQGWDEGQVVAIPGTSEKTYRTFTSALALKEWLSRRDPAFSSINIYSLGPHARRTRATFQRVLGDHVKVGVIAGEDPRCDKDNWWRTSVGTSTVIYQSLAYFYWFLFPNP